jgi:hypothetical protein
VYALFDLDSMAAKNSFKAVLGSSQLFAPGGGGEILDVWKHVFVRVAASHASKSGTRSFVVNGQAYSLGIPLTVAMTPIEIGGGWRFPISGTSRVVPYAGGEYVAVNYSETSQFAGTGDNVSKTGKGFSLLGGLEVRLYKGIIAGGEVQFRRIPNALGQGSVSQDFGEKDLGGFTGRALIGFGR